MNKETFVIDIDETIIFSERVKCGECYSVTYHYRTIDKKEIALINKAYRKGHKIILYTGRGWDCLDITIEQLQKAKVKYHSLVMGKPPGTYIDKDAKTTLKGLI
jgi:hydroxymethylpyrimidine pyrophosphatase-like HAD family hydrolase